MWFFKIIKSSIRDKFTPVSKLSRKIESSGSLSKAYFQKPVGRGSRDYEMRGALSHARIRPGNTEPAIPSAVKSPFASVLWIFIFLGTSERHRGDQRARTLLPRFIIIFPRAHFPRFTLSLMNYLWHFLTAPLSTRPRTIWFSEIGSRIERPNGEIKSQPLEKGV